MGPLGVYFLIANSVWDLLSCFTICLRDTSPSCASFANLHLALWTDEEDRTGHAAGVLFAFLLIHWSYLRALSALVEWRDVAVWTYLVEAALFVSQAAVGRMQTRLAAGATALCAVMVLVLLSEI